MHRFPLFLVLFAALYSAVARKNLLEERKRLEKQYEAHNERYRAGQETYTVGFNDLSFLSNAEYRNSYKGYSKTMDRLMGKSKYAIQLEAGSGNSVMVDGVEVSLDTPVEDLPAAVDWRVATPYVTPIKNQAKCGSCWAYASTAVLEFYVNKAANRTMTLSTEQITSCPVNALQCGGTGGCEGGTPGVAYDYVIESQGVTDADFMPYTGGTNITCVGGANSGDPSQEKFTCLEAQTGVNPFTGVNSTRMYGTITNYTILPTNDYVTMMNAIAKIGPIAISIDAGSASDPNNPNADTFKTYSGGVYNGCDAKYNTNTTDLNHLMVLEGYGHDDELDEDFWLIRNSWRSNWGEGGYMRLKRTPQDGTNCDWDPTPEDGFSCMLPDGPPATLKVCGPCGMLSQGVIPLGAKYLNAGTSQGLVYAASATDSESTDVINDDNGDSDKNLYFYLMITFAILFGVAAGLCVMMKMNRNKYGMSDGSSLTSPII